MRSYNQRRILGITLLPKIYERIVKYHDRADEPVSITGNYFDDTIGFLHDLVYFLFNGRGKNYA